MKLSNIKWTRVRPGNACPVCGNTGYCAFGESFDDRTGEVEDGWVKCMRRGFGDTSDSNGWTCERKISAGGKCKACKEDPSRRNCKCSTVFAHKWVPPGHVVRAPRNDQERESMIADREAMKKKREKRAQIEKTRRRAQLGMLWGQAETHTYLDADRVRVIPNAEGLVPASELTELGHIALRWLQSRGIDLFDVGLPRSLRVHPAAMDAWDKEAKQWNTALAMVAKISGVVPDTGKIELRALHCTYIEEHGGKVRKRSGDDNARKKHGKVEQGVVRLAGFYGEGVLIVGEGIETTLAAWLACYRSGRTWAAWAALDADSMRVMELPAAIFGEPMRDGEPAPTSRGKIHTVLIAADLDAAMKGQGAAIETAQRIMRAYPWITVEVCLPHESRFADLVERRGGVLVPKVGKGVDWNDVLCSTDTIRTFEGLLNPGVSIDLARNQVRKDQWLPSHAWGSLTVREDTPIPSRQSRPSQAAGDESVDDRGGDVPPDEPGVAAGDPGDGDIDRYLPEEALERARRFLIEKMSPPRAKRAESGFYLRRSKGEFWEYSGTRWEVVSNEHLSARVWDWMSRKQELNSDGRTQPVSVTSHHVDEVLKALQVDTAVEQGHMPCWVYPSFDSKGRPLWGSTLRGARDKRPQQDANNIIAFANVLLRADKWARGEIDVLEHTPLWFSSSVLPFDLPIDEVAQACEISAAAGRDDAAGGVHEMLLKHCPTWLKFLREVSEGNEDWIACLQEWFGYTLTQSTIMEKLLILQGPSRSGKGTIEDAWRATLGEDNVTSTNLDAICKENDLWGLVGKPLAIMSDAHVGRFTDATLAVERIKQITGQGLFSLRRLYSNDRMTLKFPTRLVITCNDMPSLMDSSTALAGRVVLLPMRLSFLNKEDRGLKPRIIAEAPGIMLWALVGLRRLWQSLAEGGGFTEPEESKKMLADFARSSSPVHAFSEDSLVVRSGVRVMVKDVYAKYKAWSESQGYKSAASVQVFSKQLKTLHPMIDTIQDTVIRDGVKSKERHFVGIMLAGDSPSGDDAGTPGGTLPGLGGPAWRSPSSLPTGSDSSSSAANDLLEGGTSV